jgi:hypothetical protein
MKGNSMKRVNLFNVVSFIAIIFAGMHASAHTSCRVFDMQQEDDFRFGHAVLNSPQLQAYIDKKGGIESIWPDKQLCSDASNLNQVLKITLAFARPGGSNVPWGLDYCQLEITLSGANVIAYRELRCDNAMEDH